MIAYRTGGGWNDITSLSRNEIVFEGRNKEYGAYALRVRYPKAMLLSLFLTGLLALLCAAIPMALRALVKGASITKDEIRVIVKPWTIQDRITKPIIPPPPAAVHPPSGTVNNRPPVITVSNTVDSLTSTVSKTIVAPINPATAGTDSSAAAPNSGTDIPLAIPEALPPPLIVVPVMPQFKGNLQDYCNTHLRYPEYERTEHIGGTVYVTFVVERDGSVSNVKLLHGVTGYPNFDREALRMVSEMPPWSPGGQGGHKVRVQLNLPVRFDGN